MQKNKVAILGVSIAIVVVVLVVGLVTNISRHNKHSSENDDSAAVLSTTTKSVASICSLTDYKKTCVDSFSSLANNQTATPKDFLQKAIQIAIEEIQFVLQRSSSSVGGNAKDNFNKMAYDDCKDLLNFAIDELQASFSEVGDARLHTINDRKEELNNWLSAVISYQQTCMDGFTQPDLKEGMSNELMNATQLTDNALAILSAMSEILSQFNITIPDVSQPNEAGSTATSRRLLNQERPPDDDYYNGRGFVPTKRLLNQDNERPPDDDSTVSSRRLLHQERPPDDDYYNGSGFVPTERLLNEDNERPPNDITTTSSRRLLHQERPPDDDYYNGSGFVPTERLLNEDSERPPDDDSTSSSRRLLHQERPPDDDYYNGSGFVPTERLLNEDNERPPDDDSTVSSRRLLNQERPPDDDYYNGKGFVPTKRLLSERPPDDDYYNGNGFVPTKRLLSEHPPDDDYYNGEGFVPTRGLLNQDERPPDDDYYNGNGFVPTRRLLNQDDERPPDDDYYNGNGFVPTRRLLNQDDNGYPKWLRGTDRHLLAAATTHSPMPTPNAVVAKDGSGQYKTITQALAAYPKKPLTGSSRYVIYVKAGVYQEYVTVTKDQPNVLIYGDGPRKTRVEGKKCFTAGVPTFQTATFIAIGNNFIAMSMGIANTAGPEGHQAVALRVQSDMAVIYNCRMDGNQDTLYAQTHRQFYRNCVISGTIDFIFGDSSCVIQNSLIIVRKPMDNQQNTVTAQGRTNIHEKTGIVIQNCRIVPDQSLQPLRFKLPTYLGRPWKQFSRAVIMESTLADFIHPDGWMPWAGTFALDTLYFAEYANRGPGANTAKRIKWKGFHVITNRRDALQFTVAPFIQGDQWLKPAGVPYSLGLIHN